MRNKEQQERMFSVINDWQQSGLSQIKYCSQHGIRYHVFHYWLRLYHRQHPAQVNAGFIPLQIEPLPGGSVQAGIEVVFGNGRRVLFYHGVSADFIKAILS